MRCGKQSGFTLLELMFASSAAMIILIPSFALLWKSAAWYEEIQSGIAVNRHARIAFDTLVNGAISTTTGNDGTKNIYGLDGRKAAPNSAFRTNYAFSYSSNNLTLTPDKFAAISIVCKATAAPLPDCVSGTKSVTGWMGADADIETSKRVVMGRTFEIIFTVTDPFEAPLLQKPSDATVAFRTIATRMRDENDP